MARFDAVCGKLIFNAGTTYAVLTPQACGRLTGWLFSPFNQQRGEE